MPDITAADRRFLHTLRDLVQVKTTGLDPSAFVIRAVYTIEMTFSPAAEDPPFKDTLVVVHASGSGSCCCLGQPAFTPSEFVGLDVRDAVASDQYLEIALLDAAMSGIQQTPTFEVVCRGSIVTKSKARAGLVIQEVLRSLGLRGRGSSSQVALVGAVGSLIMGLSSMGLHVAPTDLDPTLVGRRIAGVLVEDGRTHTLTRVAESDVAVVTGSTLSSRTFASILDVARNAGTHLVFYAQTGAHIMPALMGSGIDAVVSEVFPFYTLPGDSIVRVFRAE